jgi:HD-GYP domain-containing protein (c-di-GMP phosphodiesterase class II)
VPLVLYHHEHFDGKGYPEGLAGKGIPQGARIIHVADAFETMTSDRAYHAAMSVQDAVAEIRRCSGTQFDPEMVEAFCRVIPECVRAKEARGEVAGND